MNESTINKFCERILLGSSLEDKLYQPEKIILNEYEPFKKIPDFPGRPKPLAFNRRAAMKLPSVHLLDDDRNRGILMHFFLNHELLALEIMALTILRFPELPDSFKRGIIKTMREEQDHATLYINRMKELGVELGDVYINSFFWDCLKAMHTPKQYVTAMSLTFEQANLDFSLFYKSAFEKCGDSKTAEIMEKVYKDEIAHVSFGLKWFRNWKDPKVSDWDAYVSGLEFPLSPARAKGNSFDRGGRIRAGLKEDFIEQLEVISFSRGRAPDIYIFNAFSEAFIVQPKGFNRPEWGRALEEDLSILPLVFAKKDDLLFLYKDISVNHLKKLKEIGLELPQIEKIAPGKLIKPLSKRSPGSLKPWGWSPEMNRVFKSLINQCSNPIIWQEGFKNLFSKVWSLEVNRMLNSSETSWQEDENALGRNCRSLQEIEKAFKYYFDADWQTVCIKTPFGASGRNIMRFTNGEMTENQKGRVLNLLKKQGSLIVEPWLDRVADFSIHFDMQEKLKFQGITRLINDEHGQYSASFFGRFEQGLSKEIQSFLHSAYKGGLVEYFKRITPCLESEINNFAYKGPIGIDAFIYRSRGGELKFRSIVEMNFRYTMGRVALSLEKMLAPGKCALLKIFSIFSDRDRELAQNLVELKEERIVLNTQGKWEVGSCLINEWHDKIKFPVAVSVGNSLEACFSELNNG